MSILLNNKLLQATEARLEAGLTPEVREDYLKIVVAGQKYALHGGLQGLLASLKGRPDPIADCARGAVNIVSYLRMMAQGTMPPKAMVPAAMTLMLQALDFADKAGIVAVGQEELVRATRLFVNDITKAMGLSAEKLNQMAQMTRGVMDDPTKMMQVKLRAGLVRDPRTPEPTLPELPFPQRPNRRARRAAARGSK